MNEMINTAHTLSCQAIPIQRQEIPGGFAVVPHHLSRNKSVTDRELRLWLILHSYTKGKKACSPSVPRLASDMGCSARTVQRLLHQMEAKKLISREERIGCETSYIPAPAASIAQPTPVTAVTPDTHVTGDTDVTPSAQFVTPTPDTGVTLREEVIKKSSLRSSPKNSEKTEPSPTSVVSDSVSARAKGKKPPTDLRQFTDYFCERWQANFASKYLFEVKDGVLAAKLMKVYDLAELKRCIDLFFEDEDPWLDGKRSFGVFKQKIPGYLSSRKRLTVVPTPPNKPQFRNFADWLLKNLSVEETPEREAELLEIYEKHGRSGPSAKEEAMPLVERWKYEDWQRKNAE